MAEQLRQLQCMSEYAECPEGDRRCIQKRDHPETLHFNRAGFAWDVAESAESGIRVIQSLRGQLAQDDLLATYRQAHNAGAYELALRWADVSRHPTPRIGHHGDGILVPSTPATELDQVATMAALAEWLTLWLPIHLHRALLAGATVEQVCAASGLSAVEVGNWWRKWSDGQRDVARQLGLTDRAAEYDRVAAVLATEGARGNEGAPR